VGPFSIYREQTTRLLTVHGHVFVQISHGDADLWLTDELGRRGVSPSCCLPCIRGNEGRQLSVGLCRRGYCEVDFHGTHNGSNKGRVVMMS
jgi:hypothetical protein